MNAKIGVLLQLPSYILQIFASWITCVRVHFISDLLITVSCCFPMFYQSVLYIVVEALLFFPYFLHPVSLRMPH